MYKRVRPLKMLNSMLSHHRRFHKHDQKQIHHFEDLESQAQSH